MAELHPFFVHFPIALLVAGACFDLFGVLRKNPQQTSTAFVLQLMAAVSAILAAVSGNLAEAALVKQEALHESVMASFDRHVSLGNAMVWIIVLVVVGRTFAVLEKKEWALQGWVFPSVSTVLALLILATGLLGGALSRDILEFFIHN